jgi:plastocyanin
MTHRSGRRALLGAVLLLAAAAACSPADDPEPQVADLDFEPVETLVVDDDGFQPDELQLVAGDSITLVNEGQEPHGLDLTDPFRSTGQLEPGQEVLLRFDEEGRLEGHDTADPEQTMTIVVEPEPEG